MDYSSMVRDELVAELERRDALDYDATRIEFYERQNTTTSDAQAIVEVENWRLMGTYPRASK